MGPECSTRFLMIDDGCKLLDVGILRENVSTILYTGGRLSILASASTHKVKSRTKGVIRLNNRNGKQQRQRDGKE